MKKKLLLSISIITLSLGGYAQTAAGSCLSNINVPSYISCNDNVAFDMSGSFTIETWINPYTFGADRKLIGKTNNSFNSGFVFGLENGIYTEIWQPARTELKVGTLPAFYSWVHIAMTFSPGNPMKGYINGELVGSSNAVAPSSIATNSDDLIIGIAPWDLGALMFLGEMDEIRIWNIERTAAEIKGDLHKQLTGAETNLVALYSLNEGNGSTAGNTTSIPSLDGSITGSAWNDSYAVIGSGTMHAQTDLQAIWLGMNNNPIEDLRSTSTNNGLSVVTVVDTTNFLMYGHNDASGISSADLPQVAIDESFERTDRTWYFEVETTGNDFKSQFAFDLTDAAAGGIALSGTETSNKYTLFYKTTANGDFSAVCAANLVANNKVIFDSVAVETGYYAIGLGDNAIVSSCDGSDAPDGISTLSNTNINIYPNPTKDLLNVDIKNTNGIKNINLYDNQSQLLITAKTQNSNLQLNTSELSTGFYTLRIETNNSITTRKVSIK